jgi:hypothetical protein
LLFDIFQFPLQLVDARFALRDALIPAAYGFISLLDGSFDLRLGAGNPLLLFLEYHVNARHLAHAQRYHALLLRQS